MLFRHPYIHLRPYCSRRLICRLSSRNACRELGVVGTNQTEAASPRIYYVLINCYSDKVML